ncbi:hypothetical protein ACFU76_25695 [Streptomyces sp. NPDC057539]|uniref:helix-turn-helix transcriptional regulator n=1 Tax=Streptomyces sp. NPDC057539 TaxID=3346159 RepID=UPI0036886267
MATASHGRAAPPRSIRAAAPEGEWMSVLGPEQVAQVIGSAMRTVVVLAPERLAAPGDSPEMKGALEAARRGATVRIHLAGGWFEEQSAVGGRLTVSWSRFTLPRIAVVDSSHVLATTGKRGFSDGGLLIRRTSWAGATERQPVPTLLEPPARAAVDDRSRAVLSLLCAGMTDEEAARRLGVATRTYRRSVADLLRRVSARSRFQAGYRFAQAGLPPTVPFEEEPDN